MNTQILPKDVDEVIKYNFKNKKWDTAPPKSGFEF